MVSHQVKRLCRCENSVTIVGAAECQRCGGIAYCDCGATSPAKRYRCPACKRYRRDSLLVLAKALENPTTFSAQLWPQGLGACSCGDLAYPRGIGEYDCERCWKPVFCNCEKSNARGGICDACGHRALSELFREDREAIATMGVVAGGVVTAEKTPEKLSQPRREAEALQMVIDTFKAAADVWEEFCPDFLVKGYFHGKYKDFSVPGVLRTAAEELEKKGMGDRALYELVKNRFRDERCQGRDMTHFEEDEFPPPEEEAAFRAVTELLHTIGIEIDEKKLVVQEDEGKHRVRRSFDDPEEFNNYVYDVANTVWHGEVPYDRGVAAFTLDPEEVFAWISANVVYQEAAERLGWKT